MSRPLHPCQPIYGDIEREFGDLLALLNEDEVSRGELAMLWITAGMFATIAASSAGIAVAKTLF